MLDTIGVAKNGRLVYPPKEDELFTNWLIDCDGKFVRARYSKVGKPKTDKQLKTHFGLAVAKIRQAMEKHGFTICGILPNKTMIHEILTECCGGVGPLGQKKRLSQMTSDEAYHYFENIRDFAAQSKRFPCVIQDPDPKLAKQGVTNGHYERQTNGKRTL